MMKVLDVSKVGLIFMRFTKTEHADTTKSDKLLHNETTRLWRLVNEYFVGL
jgi:hypothetical protein